MIDHVTYEVPRGALDDPIWPAFFAVLGMDEEDPSEDVLEAGWKVRWWRSDKRRVRPATTKLHLVESGTPLILLLGLGHFCVTGVGDAGLKVAAESRWCERDSGSGRCWLAGPYGLRVEVRP